MCWRLACCLNLVGVSLVKDRGVSVIIGSDGLSREKVGDSESDVAVCCCQNSPETKNRVSNWNECVVANGSGSL